MAEKGDGAGGAAGSAAGLMLAADERRTAAVAHATVVVPVLGMFGALLLWNEGRRRSPFFAAHGAQAIALQMTMAFLWIVEGFLYTALRVSTSFIFTWMGSVSASREVSPWWFTVVASLPGLTIALLFVLQLVAVVWGLFASHAANRGRPFRYALVGRWLEDRLPTARTSERKVPRAQAEH